jgi:hypothetical protein
VSVRIVDGSIPTNAGLSFAYSLVYLFAILAIAYLFSAIMRSSVYSLVRTLAIFWDGNSQIGPIFYRTGCRVSNENTTAIRYRRPPITSVYERTFD